MNKDDLLPPPPFKRIKDAENLPPNDFDFDCFIMFTDGRIALSDGGTVCADCGLIIGWMHLHEAADFMNTRPDSKSEEQQYSDEPRRCFRCGGKTKVIYCKTCQSILPQGK